MEYTNEYLGGLVLLGICASFFIAGISKGICDSIQFHDGYKGLGYFWSRDSWKILYNPNKTLMQRLSANIMGSAWNAWHLFDWIRNGCMVLAVFLTFYSPMLDEGWLNNLLFAFFNLMSFLGAKKLSYR
jgi:hypothetical protein